MKQVEFSNSEREIINTSQGVYDDFNNFIFSSDIKVFSKLAARHKIFSDTLDVPGDIVECGVYKGSGILSWLKLKKAISPNSFKKIIGFDMFDSEELVSTLSGQDKEVMKHLFDSRSFKYKDYDQILMEKINLAGFETSDCELIKGDISLTSKNFVEKRPGLKISVLYLDLDLAIPTYDSLKAFWPRVSNGGLVVFDEYGYHQWSESQGADKFAKEFNLKIKPLNCNSPTAYIQKY